MKIEELKKNDLVYCECPYGPNSEFCRCVARVLRIDSNMVKLYVFKSTNNNKPGKCSIEPPDDGNFWII